MWRKELNVNAALVNQEEKVYFDSRRQMNYQIIRSTWIGDYNDPNSFLNIWTAGGGNNQTGWSNPEYDRLIAEAEKTADQTARYAAFQKAEAILLVRCGTVQVVGGRIVISGSHAVHLVRIIHPGHCEQYYLSL